MAQTETRWRTWSKQVIARVDKELPSDASEKEVRKAISQAYPFGERSMFPYQVWLQEVKRYIDRRFSTTPPDVPAVSGSLWEAR